MSLMASPLTAYFYPRPPRGGRPAASGLYKTTVDISIHALREEGDITTGLSGSKVLHFYPRPPRGGRQYSGAGRPPLNTFLSTPSARRATVNSWIVYVLVSISIHALREEGDSRETRRQINHTRFLSTPSARRATFDC